MYAKLFSSIFQGTLRGNSHGLLVFTNLLAHADKAGIVDIHPRVIAEEVGLTVEQVRVALDELEAPDPDSRTPDEEGRRIAQVDGHRTWGWRIVNHAKYRAIRSEDDRREQNRLAQAVWREKQKALHKQSKPASATLSRESAQSAHTDTEAYTDTEDLSAIPSGIASSVAPTRPAKTPSAKTLTDIPCPYQAIIDAYHAILPNLPSVKLFSEGRKTRMRKLWGWVLSSKKSDKTRRATNGDEAMAWIEGYFSHAAHSDFLMGRSPRNPQHAGWKCDIDFLMTESGMKQVLEKTEAA